MWVVGARVLLVRVVGARVLLVRVVGARVPLVGVVGARVLLVGVVGALVCWPQTTALPVVAKVNRANGTSSGFLASAHIMSEWVG